MRGELREPGKLVLEKRARRARPSKTAIYFASATKYRCTRVASSVISNCV